MPKQKSLESYNSDSNQLCSSSAVSPLWGMWSLPVAMVLATVTQCQVFPKLGSQGPSEYQHPACLCPTSSFLKRWIAVGLGLRAKLALPSGLELC